VTADTQPQLANFIWSICNLLRGPYKRNEYRKVILPLTVLRRFDCLLAPTKAQVLAEHPKIKAKPETVVRSLLEKITERPFYNLSKLDLPKLLDDPNQLAPNLNAYINGFSPNVRAIMERFAFDQQVAKMAEKNLLYAVVKAFCDPKIDLTFPTPPPRAAPRRPTPPPALSAPRSSRARSHAASRQIGGKAPACCSPATSRSRRWKIATVWRSSSDTTPTTTSGAGWISTGSSTDNCSPTLTASRSGFATGSSKARGRYELSRAATVGTRAGQLD
jgi:hypothetical protein